MSVIKRVGDTIGGVPLAYAVGGEPVAGTKMGRKPEAQTILPENMTKRQLYKNICDGCECAGCEVMCGFGKEYLKRKADGRL